VGRLVSSSRPPAGVNQVEDLLVSSSSNRYKRRSQRPERLPVEPLEERKGVPLTAPLLLPLTAQQAAEKLSSWSDRWKP